MVGETLQDDLDGLRLKLFRPKREQIYLAETQAIALAIMKHTARAHLPKKTSFDVPWAKKLHKDMFGAVWKWAGEYRTVNLNIGVDKTQINLRLMQLFDDVKFWREGKTYDVLEQAVRLHHGAVLIHPFKNGNGRWSRLLADLWLLQNGHGMMQWPLAVDGPESPIRGDYLAALKAADQHDFTALIDLHRRYQS